MRNFYFILFLALSTTSTYSQVTLPHLEPFNYIVGTSLQTQPNWTGVNTGDDLLIVSGNLDYNGLPIATGHKLTMGGAGIDAYKLIVLQNSGTVYYSLLLNISSMTTVTDPNGGYIAHFIQTGTNYGGSLWTKKVDDTHFNLGIEVRAASGISTSWTTTAYATGQTHLIVVAYTFNSGSTNDDEVKLWVNPTLGGTEPSPTITDTHSGTDLTSIGSIALRQDSATETPVALEIDELRIANNWSDVTQTANLSTHENNITGLNVYPNPVTDGILYIKTTDNSEKTVLIYDVLGKQVSNSTTENKMINVTKLNPGVYILKITENGKTALRKLLIK